MRVHKWFTLARPLHLLALAPLPTAAFLLLMSLNQYLYWRRISLKERENKRWGGLTFKNVKMGVNGSEAERSLSESAERELGESKYEKYWRGGEKWKKQRHRAQRTMGAHSLSSHVRPKAQREPRVVNHQSCSPAPALHELAYTRSNKQQELLQVLPSNFRVKFLSLL